MTLIPRRVYDFRPGLAEGDPARVDVLGGKGASLAAMSRVGFPVPPGFTIAAECCAWVERHGRWPDGLQDEVRGAMSRLEAAAERTFGRGPRPLLVAVRSGAAASMPGMMDTILNCGLQPGIVDFYPASDVFWRDYAEHIRMYAISVAGLKMSPETAAGPGAASGPEAVARRRLQQWLDHTGRPFPSDPWEALVASIDAVFASWNSERARVYRRRNDVRNVTGTAVNVQLMFPAQRSGVLFTANPNDPCAGEIVIEASWGLGEAVVSGAVTPDIYVLDARTFDMQRTSAGTRPGDEAALTPAQIDELARLGRDVELHFDAPCDIEWGWADGRFALLQARAIRGLDVLADVERARAEEIERLRAEAGARHVVWVEHNLAETLLFPTPLTWDVVRWFMSGRGGYGQLYRTLGFCPSPTVDERGFLDLIGGRIYADPRRAAQMFFGSLPFEYDVEAVLADRRALEAPPRHLNLDDADPFLFARLPGLVWQLWSVSRNSRRLASDMPQRFDEYVGNELQQFLDETNRLPLDHFDNAALVNEFLRRRDWVLGPLAAESLLPGYFGGLALARLTAWLAQLLGAAEGESLAVELTSGLVGDITVEQNLVLAAVARGEKPLAHFLAGFGHRAVGEMELAEPRWNEDSATLQQLAARLRSARGPSPADRHSAQVARREESERGLSARLVAAGGSALREQVQAELSDAQRLLPYRETGKFHLMRGYATLRPPLVELARRWDLGRDLFFLHLDELSEYPQRIGELKARIVQRKLRWQSAQRLRWGDRIDSQHLDRLGTTTPDGNRPPAVRGIREWSARCLASGTVIGTAVIVRDPGDVGPLPDDYILICPSTDPGWTPLLVGARGLVVERGGVLSHGAIVARDFGIPSVALEDATTLIPDGSRLELDARIGRIRWLEGA